MDSLHWFIYGLLFPVIEIRIISSCSMTTSPSTDLMRSFLDKSYILNNNYIINEATNSYTISNLLSR